MEGIPDGEIVTQSSGGRGGARQSRAKRSASRAATGAELLVLWGEAESDGAAPAGATTRTAGRPNQPTGPIVTILATTPLDRSPPFCLLKGVYVTRAVRASVTSPAGVSDRSSWVGVHSGGSNKVSVRPHGSWRVDSPVMADVT